MADPGFPRGGTPTSKEDAPSYYGNIFAESCVKMKEIGPRGGYVFIASPSLDPAMQLNRKLSPARNLTTSKTNPGGIKNRYLDSSIKNGIRQKVEIKSINVGNHRTRLVCFLIIFRCTTERRTK